MSFDVAATAYEAFMGRWSMHLSAPFADLAGIAPGQHVLDVGCGPGMLTAELVERLGAARVAAVDPSEPFVEAIHERFPGVEATRAPAEAIPHPDGAFDATLAQLVVHFMTDPVAGLTEMRRVTRRGGTVAASVWDYGGGRAPLNAFWAAVDALGMPVAEEVDRPGTKDGHLASLMTEAGIRDVRSHELASTRTFATFDEWWEPYRMGVGPAGAYLRSLDEDGVARIREACRDGIGDGPVTLTAVAWAAVGRA